MTVPPNLVTTLPNLPEIGRDVAFRDEDKGSGYVYNTLGSPDREAFIGTDLTIVNDVGSNIVITIDGRSRTVPTSGLELSNFFFSEVKITTAASAAVDLDIQGISLPLAKKLSKQKSLTTEVWR